jgi:WD40 repeat protein
MMQSECDHCFFSIHPIKAYLASQCENELRCCLRLAGDRDEVFCLLQRRFSPTSSDQDSPVASMYFDTYEEDGDRSTRNLKPIHEYEIDFRSGLDISLEQHRQYLILLLNDICKVLLDSLDRVEARLAVTPDPLIDEARLHLAFAKLRAERFSPTGSSSAALDRAMGWMREVGGKTYVLYGLSGAGKTYVVAKLMVELSKENTSFCVVRFLGTSGDSADISSLLRSICQQLRAMSMGREAYIAGPGLQSSNGLPPCPVAHEDLVKYFNQAINMWAWGRLVLVLESLDQLNDTNSGRKLDWLPVDQYSRHVHILCSTLPDELNPEVGRPFRCLSILESRIPDRQRFAEVAALKDSASLVKHLMKLKHRQVNDKQLAALVQAMAQAQGTAQTPLMATLMADKARHWRSSTPASLPRSVREIILEFFGELVSQFEVLEQTKQAGARLVKHALSYITLVKKGISDTELQEILSLDDDVLADSHLWWFTPDRKMPSAPLQLLLRSLGPYLSSRGQRVGGALSVWYHRQLWEASEAHYLKEDAFRASCHRVMAEFFIGRFSTDPKPCNDSLRIRLGLSHKAASAGVKRHVRDQPLVLKGTSVFHPDAIMNERRCTEAMHHMVKVLEILAKVPGMQRQILEYSKLAEVELCSAEAVCARLLSGETFDLLRQSATFLQFVSKADIDFVNVDHFNRWIRRDAHDFDSTLGLTLSALSQPLSSKARELFMGCRKLQRVRGLPRLVLGGTVDFNSIVSVLKGHEKVVCCTDWHDQRLVSGDDSGLIIVWDALTGEKVMQLKGHSGAVRSVAWSPKGEQIVSGSSDKTCIIWDAATGDKVSELNGHSHYVTSVAWSPTGGRIVSGSVDETLIIWDAATNEKISQLKSHTNNVNSVAWSPKGDQIVSGGLGSGGLGSDGCESPGEIFIWDAATGDKVSALKGHSKAVMSVAWSPKGGQIVSGSNDQTCIIWDTATGDKVSELKGHADWVRGVAWSGNQIVSCSNDKTLIIWDATTGKQVSKLEGHDRWVTSVAWSPKGDQIVSTSRDNTCIIWDAAAAGEKISEAKGYTSYVKSVAWSPKGDKVVSGAGYCNHSSIPGEIMIWDAATGDKISELKGHLGCVQSVAWSPKGDQIVSGSKDATCIIWDASSGDKISQLKGHLYSVTSVAWSPKGDQIVSGGLGSGDWWVSRGEIIIWNAATGDKVLALKGHSKAVMSIAWSPKGDQILSGSEDGTVIIWNVGSGDIAEINAGSEEVFSGCCGLNLFRSARKKANWRVHWGPVNSVAWSPKGDQIVSTSFDNTCIIWDTATGGKVSELKGHTWDVTSVAWSPQGDQILSGSWDKTCIIWNAATGDKVSELKGHTSYVNSVAWSNEGDKIVSGSRDDTCIIWDARTGDKVPQLKGHSNSVNSVAWNPKGDQIVSSSYEQTCIIWDAATGDKVSELKGHTHLVRSVAWSPKGDQIISFGFNSSGSERDPGEMFVWDSASGEKVLELKGHFYAVRSVAWSPEGDQIVSGSNDQTCIIWDAATGNKISMFEGHTGPVNCVAWKDDQIVSCSDDKTLIIWDAASGKQVSKLEGHAAEVMSVAWNPVANQIVSGSQDKTAMVWDTATGDKISELKGHTDWVRSVSWSNDGKQIATASDDKTVLVWDAAKGEILSKLEGHNGYVMSVAWSPSGSRLVSGSDDTTAVVWDAAKGEQVV